MGSHHCYLQLIPYHWCFSNIHLEAFLEHILWVWLLVYLDLYKFLKIKFKNQNQFKSILVIITKALCLAAEQRQRNLKLQ